MRVLEVHSLNAWYGASHVVRDVSLTVNEGEILALIGRNGAGKSSTMKAIMGLMPRATGQVLFVGQDVLPLPSHARFRLGLAYVPEDRRIVSGLTVRENLQIGLVACAERSDVTQRIEEIGASFPRLKERLDQQGTTLSGGEQQMLAIARAMIARPRLILLDEPSEGIMPAMVEDMGELFRRLRAGGTTLLLVEQNVEWALGLADRAVIIDQGEIVHECAAADLLADAAAQERYCAV